MEISDVWHLIITITGTSITFVLAMFIGLLKWTTAKYITNQEKLERLVLEMEKRLLTIEDNHLRKSDLTQIVTEIKNSIDQNISRVHDRIDHIYRNMQMKIRDGE